MITKNLKSVTLLLALLLAGFLLFACDDSDDEKASNENTQNEDSGDGDVDDAGDGDLDDETAEEFPASIEYEVKPTKYPKGVGIDFESATSYNLKDSDIPADWKYDIRIKTIKGIASDGTSKGCPHIKLYKKITTAYEYEQTGEEAFTLLTLDDVDETKLATDDIEEIDDDSVVNDSGIYDYELLHQYYIENLVTQDSLHWLPSDWTLGTSELIFIIKTEEGNLYKLSILGMGTDSGTAPASGTVELVFKEIE